jgi:hypothetical protein
MISVRARGRMFWRLVTTGASALALLTGCDLINPQTCTLIGAGPGVNFEVPAALFPNAAATYLLRACADQSCVEWNTHGGEPTFGTVGLPAGDWPGVVTARLTITHTDLTRNVAEVVFDANTSVEVTLYEPNGPGCEPHVFTGAARATPDGRLEAIIRYA